MKELSIVQLKSELRTDSRLLAGFLDHRHRTILENVDKYHAELKSISDLPIQTEAGLPRPQGGTSVIRYALLNEDQCYFLLTLMRNNERVVAAKLALVKAFSNARAQLANRDIARLDGKVVRKAETDSIKLLVEYASAAGSKSESHYYANVTRMTNSLLGIDTGARDSLDANQLKQVAILEGVVDIAIRDGMKAEMPYKDIYQLAKERASHVVQAVGIIGGGV